MSLKEPPFTQPMVDPETGNITLPWMDYFRFWKTINDKVDAMSTYTPGNLVKVSSDGGIVDGGSSFAISKFSAYDITGEQTLGITAWVDLDWDKETWKDSDFTHDDETPGATITCNFDGKVDITVYGTVYVDTHVATSQVQLKGQYYDGDAWADIGGLLAQMTFTAVDQRLNFTIVQPLTVKDGYQIKVSGDVISGGSTVKTVAGACGLKIERKS